jgi:hypothetical protein
VRKRKPTAINPPKSLPFIAFGKIFLRKKGFGIAYSVTRIKTGY